MLTLVWFWMVLLQVSQYVNSSVVLDGSTAGISVS